MPEESQKAFAEVKIESGGRQRKAVLINDQYAVCHGHRDVVMLVRIEPIGEGVYEIVDQPIWLGVGGRTYKTLTEYANKLLTMSAFELLTGHFDQDGTNFHLFTHYPPF